MHIGTGYSTGLMLCVTVCNFALDPHFSQPSVQSHSIGIETDHLHLMLCLKDAKNPKPEEMSDQQLVWIGKVSLVL